MISIQAQQDVSDACSETGSIVTNPARQRLQKGKAAGSARSTASDGDLDHATNVRSIQLFDFIIIALAPCSGLDICLFMLLTIPVVSLRSSCGVTALLLTFFFRSFSWTFREPCRARRGEANAAASGRPSRRSAQVFGTTVEASSRLRRRPAPRLAVCTSSKVYRHCTLPANMLRLTIIL